MELSDKYTYSQIIGGLMNNPQLFFEYPDISVKDFDDNTIRLIFATVYNLFKNGKKEISPIDVDAMIQLSSANAMIFNKNKGSDFLIDAYNNANVGEFEYYYNRLRKLSLLRALKRNSYDISDFYRESYQTIKEEREVLERLENATIDDIISSVEKKLTLIKNDYYNCGSKKSNPADGINQLIEKLRTSPAVGEELSGDIFTSITRGARKGCYYLKAASTSCGKTRTSVFDACKIAFPVKYSYALSTPDFIIEKDDEGKDRSPMKVLFIVTEMDKEELQTIMLAYLSGLNETKILKGDYNFNEYERVKAAASIIEKYKDYFYIEEISDPNLNNVETVIKKYATLEHVEYVFFDYIHSTGSLLGQFTKSGVGEHTMLMMLSNQLKQLAKDLNIFVFSSTQVNATGMTSEDGSFKNETCIRGSKAIADKADCGYIMTKVDEKFWNSVKMKFSGSPRYNSIMSTRRHMAPTHVLDVYKMRQGQFKNVRIWIWLDLGNGEREDLFITDADNNLIVMTPNDGKLYKEEPVKIVI